MGEIKKLADIVVEARAKGRKKMAVAYGQDSHTLEAVYAAYKEGLVEPILYGEKAVIEQVCAEHGIDVSVFTIVDEKSDVKCVAQAVKAVAEGMKNGIDPRKWICVGADEIMAAGYGDTVMFIMLDSQLDLSAQTYVDAFAQVTGGELDLPI